ncbi:hypothetical protein [Neisseria sp. Ec49-e6-T10]|uniref:hypothetical protein n=1 Tax=Neisseria sp. Ec49-e6-T10 TaxID=3140744 RepID=UPI003EB9F8DE
MYRLLTFCMILTLFGCGHAPNYSGSWKPLNTYSSQIEEIPLAKPYEYTVLPIDKTLKALLERWTADSKIMLSYQSTFDYTLPRSVGQIKEHDLPQAIAWLNQFYANKGVVIRQEGDYLVTVTNFVVESPKEKPALTGVFPKTDGYR